MHSDYNEMYEYFFELTIRWAVATCTVYHTMSSRCRTSKLQHYYLNQSTALAEARFRPTEPSHYRAPNTAAFVPPGGTVPGQHVRKLPGNFHHSLGSHYILMPPLSLLGFSVSNGYWPSTPDLLRSLPDHPSFSMSLLTAFPDSVLVLIPCLHPSLSSSRPPFFSGNPAGP